ncbi:hypothetical protein [Alteromonas facilis]|uniref:hypothetical protein n=1 Tax=Alteromonas facilis TaxID=2048004 RepID=UPI000C283784|nr:hypothetical protein [Alteromonas facilis]
MKYVFAMVIFLPSFLASAQLQDDYDADRAEKILKLSLVDINNGYPQNASGIDLQPIALTFTKSIQMGERFGYFGRAEKDAQHAVLRQEIHLRGSALQNAKKMGVEPVGKRLSVLSGCQTMTQLRESFARYGYNFEALPLNLKLSFDITQNGDTSTATSHSFDVGTDCSPEAIELASAPTVHERISAQIANYNATLPQKVDESTNVILASYAKNDTLDEYYLEIHTKMNNLAFDSENTSKIRQFLVGKSAGIICGWKNLINDGLNSTGESTGSIGFRTRLTYFDKNDKKIVITNEAADNECEAALR